MGMALQLPPRDTQKAADICLILQPYLLPQRRQAPTRRPSHDMLASSTAGSARLSPKAMSPICAPPHPTPRRLRARPILVKNLVHRLLLQLASRNWSIAVVVNGKLKGTGQP